MRKVLVPTETLVIDLLKPDNQNVDKATGISALQFESSMGTRFMCGLENGLVKCVVIDIKAQSSYGFAFYQKGIKFLLVLENNHHIIQAS